MSNNDPAQHESPLPHLSDEEERTALAWLRYKRLMSWMVVATIITVLLAVAYLHISGGPVPIPMLIATITGAGFSVLLGTALMGLVYFSNNSGHDEAVSRKDDKNDHA
jgi:hypothetical protein